MTKTLLALLLLAGSAFAQTALPTSWFGAGAAFNPSATPNVAGWASYAHLMSDKAQTYSFTSYDVTSVNPKTFTAQSSVRTGVATVLKQYKGLYLLGFGDAGVALTGSNIGSAFSGGGAGVIRIGKTKWTAVVAARVLKTALSGQQAVYEFGVGRISE